MPARLPQFRIQWTDEKAQAPLKGVLACAETGWGGRFGGAIMQKRRCLRASAAVTSVGLRGDVTLFS
jgi:hypothetical protein